ncbi:MAG: PA0069 family radical SAM protein [Woeseiaceae bacterium]
MPNYQGHKSRGAISAPEGRFSNRPIALDDDEVHARAQRTPETEIRAMPASRIISTNNSPDVPFERSINPYQGCEHGCIYCYARPSHSYLDLSPGLDFETKIFYKPNAAAKLLETWERPGYECKPITLGANTDPYQPAERQLALTRALLTAFLEHRHPVNIITKGALICRDIDLLEKLAAADLCSVAISLPTVDLELKRIMEPRVPSAASRLKAIRTLTDAGVPTSVLVAPIIPAINDHEIEEILRSAATAGAYQARYIFLRLPHELKALFAEWLSAHFPERAERVSSLIRQASGGHDYDNRFGIRQTGRGPYADMLASRFIAASRRFGLQPHAYQKSLDCTQFLRPGPEQLGLGL